MTPLVAPDAVEAAMLTEVRDDLIEHRAYCERDGWALIGQDAPTGDAVGAEFDRWLAEHDAQVAQQALFDAADALMFEQADRCIVAQDHRRSLSELAEDAHNDDIEFLRARAATLTPKEKS